MTVPVVWAVHLVGIRRYLKKLRATRNRASANAQQYSSQKSAIRSTNPPRYPLTLVPLAPPSRSYISETMTPRTQRSTMTIIGPLWRSMIATYSRMKALGK